MAKVSSEYTASNDVGVVAVEPGSCKHCGKCRQVFLIGALILDSAELAVFFGEEGQLFLLLLCLERS